MKFLVVISLFGIFNFTFGKDIDQKETATNFHKALSEDIESVIRQNPQVYDSNAPGLRIREPASIKIDYMDKSEQMNSFEKLHIGSPK